MRPRAWASWLAFAFAHVVVAVLGWVLPGQPMNDVALVYQPWAEAALAGDVMGITATWVYPQVAIVPLLLAQLLAAPFVAVLGAQNAYLVGWAVLVTSCALAGFAGLVGRGRTGPRRAAGWFWTAALVLLGPIAIYRIDAVTVPLAVAAGTWLARRPVAGAALLTIGAWMKIWPGAVLAAAAVAMRHRARVVMTGVALSAAIVALLWALGADDELFGFLGVQAGRGLQVEAVAATPFLWLAASGAASVEYRFDILTYQIRGEGAETVAALLTPVMVIVVAGLLVLGTVRVRRGAAWQSTLPPLAAALVSALIVTNKVGSPQFQTWLIAPLALWLLFDGRRAGTATTLTLLLCVLTFAVYPLTYDGLLRAEPLPLVLLTARNALAVVLLIHTIRAVARTPARRGRSVHAE